MSCSGMNFHAKDHAFVGAVQAKTGYSASCHDCLRGAVLGRRCGWKSATTSSSCQILWCHFLKFSSFPVSGSASQPPSEAPLVTYSAHSQALCGHSNTVGPGVGWLGGCRRCELFLRSQCDPDAPLELRSALLKRLPTP